LPAQVGEEWHDSTLASVLIGVAWYIRGKLLEALSLAGVAHEEAVLADRFVYKGLLVLCA
jgi:hypothetical protein